MRRSLPYRQFAKSVNLVNEAFLPGLFALYGFADTLGHNFDAYCQWSAGVFPGNVIHEVSNYELLKLPKLLDDSAALQCRSAFIFLQAAVEGYIHDLEESLLLLGIYTRPNIDEPEERLASYAGRSAGSLFGVWPELTLRYLRLRRNALLHRSGKPTVKLLSVIDRGERLNSYWIDKGAIKNGFDFESLDLTHLGWREVLDVLRIVRMLISGVDDAVISAFGSTLIDATINQRCKEIVAETKNWSVREARWRILYWTRAAHGGLTDEEVAHARIAIGKYSEAAIEAADAAGAINNKFTRARSSDSQR